jgi:hypothetical protein
MSELVEKYKKLMVDWESSAKGAYVEGACTMMVEYWLKMTTEERRIAGLWLDDWTKRRDRRQRAEAIVTQIAELSVELSEILVELRSLEPTP